MADKSSYQNVVAGSNPLTTSQIIIIGVSVGCGFLVLAVLVCIIYALVQKSGRRRCPRHRYISQVSMAKSDFWPFSTVKSPPPTLCSPDHDRRIFFVDNSCNGRPTHGQFTGCGNQPRPHRPCSPPPVRRCASSCQVRRAYTPPPVRRCGNGHPIGLHRANSTPTLNRCARGHRIIRRPRCRRASDSGPMSSLHPPFYARLLDSCDPQRYWPQELSMRHFNRDAWEAGRDPFLWRQGAE